MITAAIFAYLFASVVFAAPQYNYQAPRDPLPPPPPPTQTYIAPGGGTRAGAGSSISQVQIAQPVVNILRDNREFVGDGTYRFDFESEDGIQRSEAGQLNGEGAVVQIGEYSYTMPDGTLFTLRFVADENGFQPQSDFLPVAPENPHPIPDFVLAQIEKARIEDEAAARASAQETRQVGTSYVAPQPAPPPPSQIYQRP